MDSCRQTHKSSSAPTLSSKNSSRHFVLVKSQVMRCQLSTADRLPDTSTRGPSYVIVLGLVPADAVRRLASLKTVAHRRCLSFVIVCGLVPSDAVRHLASLKTVTHRRCLSFVIVCGLMPADAVGRLAS